MSEAGKDSTTQVTNVNGSEKEQVDISLQDAAQQRADNGATTAESFGVSQEQFDKFYDAKTGSYDWKSHAKETEYKLQQREPADAAPKTDDQKPTEQPKADDEAKTAADKAGLDWDALTNKIVEQGDIDAADYAKLEEIGIPKDVAQDYVEKSLSDAKAHYDNVISAFGGEDNLIKIRDYVRKSGLSEDKIKSVEADLADKEKYKGAVDSLLAEAGITPPEKGSAVDTPNQSTGTSGDDVKPYATQAEMVSDQMKPEYKKDPKFREHVAKRAAKSKWDNNPRSHTSGL